MTDIKPSQITNCTICPHMCEIKKGHTGFCNARKNIDGKIESINYGKITSMSLDPIEKKPIKRFKPGSKVLSIGSFGCNLRCGFCQNHRISMSDSESTHMSEYTLAELRNKVIETTELGNIGLAYTYNEPLIGYEFVRDMSEIIHEEGLSNVLVTNGYINKKPLNELLLYIDAVNVDLKSFNNDFYREIDGDLETVKQSIEILAHHCHVEVTCLIIPNENDSTDEITEMSNWISGISRDIPLHLSRFFPNYHYSTQKETSREKIDSLYDIAKQNLNYVYKGNY